MAKIVSRLRKLRSAIEGLLDESMFRSEGEPTRFYKFLHFWVLVAKSFIKNRCPVRASALSFVTLLALIPMLAVALSVTSSLLKKEGEAQIYQFVDRFVSGIVPHVEIPTNSPASGPDSEALSASNAMAATNLDALTSNSTNAPENISEHASTALNVSNAAPATVSSATTNGAPASQDERNVLVQKAAAQRIHDFIQSASSGTLKVTSMVVLIFIAISMLSRIEETFNDIWGVTRGRSWHLRIVLYWTTITLGPLLLAAVLGLASGPHLRGTQHFIHKWPFVGGLIFKLLPLVLLWIAFALFYKAMPNTKVHFNAAFVGAMVSGTALHLNNVFGFLYVSRVVTYSKIYGSLGLVPVFMAGLYISWVILLFGAQVAYAFQNRALYLQEKLAEHVNQRGREFVALRLMTCLAQRFHRGLPPPTIQEMSTELGIPSRLVQQVLQTLLAARLVVEISGLEPAYSPARPLENINAHHVLMAMRATQGQELVTRDEPVREEVYGEFARIQEAEKQVASGISMLALVNRAEARLQIAPPPSPDEEIKLKPALVPSGSKSAMEFKPTVAPSDDEFIETPLEEMKPNEAKPEASPKQTAMAASDDEREFPL